MSDTDNPAPQIIPVLFYVIDGVESTDQSQSSAGSGPQQGHGSDRQKADRLRGMKGVN